MRSNLITATLLALFFLSPVNLRAQTEPAPDLAKEIASLRESHQRMQQLLKDLQDELLDHDDVESGEADDLSSQRKFSIYGFFDMSFQQYWLPREGLARFVDEEQHTFLFGNLNTYFDFNPLPDWRFLAEIRFLLNPVGDIQTYEIPILGTEFSYVDATTTDRSNLLEEFQFGAIEIERAHMEWNGQDWFNVTLGLFLTPYGIWNVDHGSPTRITVTAPALYSSYLSAFPERQLGIKLHGNFLVGGVNLAYDLTLSNGRGVADTLKDSNWDKAVGGRLEASNSGNFRWKAGVSAYSGEVTHSKWLVDLSQGIDVRREITVQYREWSLAADLQLEFGPFEAQWEIMANWRNYDDRHRPPMLLFSSFASTGGIIPGDMGSFSSGGLAPDKVAWGTYGMITYRLPLTGLNLRLYSQLGWVDFDDNTPYENSLSVSVGLNWRISGAVVVKLGYTWAHWPNDEPDEKLIPFASEDLHRVTGQVAIAF